jgi:hypothetical protein
MEKLWPLSAASPRTLHPSAPIVQKAFQSYAAEYVACRSLKERRDRLEAKPFYCGKAASPALRRLDALSPPVVV